jgi:hypothetical protein
VSDIREHLANYRAYLLAAQQNIVSAQSRLKRLTVEKGAKGVDFTGQMPIDNNVDIYEMVELDDNQSTTIETPNENIDTGWGE